MAKIRWHRTIQRTVGDGDEELINATGRQIVVVEATAAFLLSVDQEPFVELEKSFTLQLADDQEFKSVRVRNESGAPNTIKLQIGFTNIRDGRLGVTGGVEIAPHGTLDSLPDVSLLTTATTQILAADTSRKEAIISNLATNTVTFRIGDSGAGAANGIPLPPGATIVLTTSAEIQGHNPTAGAESVAVTVLK